MAQAPTPAGANGTVAGSGGMPEGAEGVQTAVRTAVRTARLELGGDYEGWWVVMRVNPPLQVWEGFSSGDTERYDSALAALVIDWNFVDDDGQPLALPKDGLDWSSAPFDLKLVLTNAYTAKVQERMSLGKTQSTPSALMSPSDT